MLLDQKRTRRMVQITAILTSIAFAGVIFVVLGLVFFGGGGTTVADQQLNDAQDQVEREPNSADAWERLASAYAGADQPEDAIAAARKAVALDPDDFRRLLTLITLQDQQGDTAAAISAVQGYTASHPKNAEAFLQLGTLAESGGRTDLARLSYEAYLRLAPDDPNAEAVRERIRSLGGANR